MTGFSAATISAMTRRLVLALGGVVVLALLLADAQGWQALRRSLAAQAGRNLTLLVQSQAATLGARLTLAARCADDWSRAGSDASRQDGSAPLLGALWASVGSIEQGTARLPLTLGAAELQALRSGRQLLRYAAPRAGKPALYLVRMAAGEARVGLFEISTDWLWTGVTLDVDQQQHLAVLDGYGAVLRTAVAPDADLEFLFARERDYGNQGEPGGVALRAWRVGGQALRGAVGRLSVQASGLAAPDWILIAWQPQHEGLQAWQAIAPTLLWQLPCCVLLVAVAAWLLRLRWVPVLQRLQAGLGELAAGRFEVLRLGQAADEPRRVGEAYNQALAALEERLQTQQALAEIDQQLLAAADFEQSLDAVLMAVRRVTRCHGSALVLLDRDAPSHARCYYSLDGSDKCQVRRHVLEGAWLDYLATNPDGVTIARWEPDRHAFLEALDEAGAGCYWVWPVVRQEQVVAILVVGFRDAPLLRPAIAACGRECARRISVALSNSARDEQLYRQAHFDALTALPNRLLFRDRLAQAVAGGGPQSGALLYVDLDHFKEVNDSVGHAAGDQLLTIVAQRLRSCVKEGDTVARLGGDEFTVILHAIGSREDAAGVAQRISAAVQMPVHLAGRDHYVRASIGITVFPDDGSNIDELMRNADLAMYQAKDGGRSRAVFFSTQLVRQQAPVAQSGLYRALRRREFTLYYQPQYSLQDGALIGLEALLRWQSPRDGLRGANEFVPAAEQSGVIVDIGAWVLESACSQLASWREQGIAPPRLALNLSAQQLLQPDFPQQVRRTLDRFGLPAQMLELELSEPMLVQPELRERLQQLAAQGLHVALDDFGIDRASLNHLRLAQVHTIKIDRTLLQDVGVSAGAATLAQSVITLAHALGKRVVAEGVESLEQLGFLREHGCDAAQGFFLAQPRSAADTSHLLAQGHQLNGASPPQQQAG